MTLSQAAAQGILDTKFAPWIQALQLTLSVFDEGHARLDMPITDQLTRMGDVLSGQALAALADTAMVFACFAYDRAPTPVATTTLDVQFLRPGTGTLVSCDAYVVRAGKSVLFTRAEMIAQPAGKAIATATATFFRA